MCGDGTAWAWRGMVAGDTLEHVHFSRLSKGRVLAVVVTSSGLVRDRMLTMEADVTARELEAAANFLNEHFRGWSIERVRAEIGRLVERERSEYQRLLSSVEQLWAGAVPEGSAAVQTVYVEGVANLLGSARRGQRGGRWRGCARCWRRWRRSSGWWSCWMRISTRNRSRCG